jgi:hypothetical protein
MRLKLDLIAATNRQPIAELLTALAYLVAGIAQTAIPPDVRAAGSARVHATAKVRR